MGSRANSTCLRDNVSDYCSINGNSYLKSEIANLSWREYISFSLYQMPNKLYKFYPNTIDPNNGRNYSQEALKNNTVFLQSPLRFDDPYDSTLYLDEREFHEVRLKYYADLCGFQYDKTWDIDRLVHEFGLYLLPHIHNQSEWESLFHVDSSQDDLLNKSHQVFELDLCNEILRNLQKEDILQIAFYHALHQEFLSKQTDLIQKFRVTCFATTPFSMLMWAHYADSHKGFCVEYEIPTPDEQNITLLQNLMPVIYSDERVSVLNECLADLIDPGVSEDTVGAIYKYGLLTKSIDWKYQNEWRLISLDTMLTDESYNCIFFPISKVYIGAKMPDGKRREIIKICNSRSIPSTCVLPAFSSFSMQECTGKMLNPNCIYKKLS